MSDALLDQTILNILEQRLGRDRVVGRDQRRQQGAQEEKSDQGGGGGDPRVLAGELEQPDPIADRRFNGGGEGRCGAHE